MSTKSIVVISIVLILLAIIGCFISRIHIYPRGAGFSLSYQRLWWTNNVDYLISRLKDKDPYDQIAGPCGGILLGGNNSVEKLSRIGGRAVPALMESLDSEDWSTREGAAIALKNIKDPRAEDKLIEALSKEKNSDVITAMADAVASYGNKKALLALKKQIVEDGRGRNIVGVFLALDQILPNNDIDILDYTLKNYKSYSSWAIRLLEKRNTSKDIIERIIKTLDEEEYYVRPEVEYLINHIEDDEIENIEFSTIRKKAIIAIIKNWYNQNKDNLVFDEKTQKLKVKGT